MRDQTLILVIDELGAQGYDVAALCELQVELDVLDRPPSLLGRMTTAARDTASRHWRNLVGELGESKEAMTIIAARVRGDVVSLEERDKVRAQLLDLVKVFPAGLIAAANSALPIPGTGLFTPWILTRLGLMPSRWREAHMLEQLREQRDRLRAHGCVRQADALEQLRTRIEHESDARHHVGHDAGLLTHWDANRNGAWDPEECHAYRRELDRMRELANRFAPRKQWFLEHEGEIFGALRLTELLEDPECREHLEDDCMVVCFDGKTGWVALPDLLGREPRFA